MTDCLIIGFNDSSFEDYVKLVHSMGANSGAYRDLNLAFIEYEGKPYRSMDILNRFYGESHGGIHKPFHNSDFMWPVVTYLSTYLDRRGFTHDYVNLFHMEREKLKEKLLHDDIRTVTITTTLYVSVHPILEIISFIRQYNDKAQIIVGGPYISNQVKTTDVEGLQGLFKFIDADFYVISSEGELALTSILAAIKHGQSFDLIDNIAYREGDHYVVTAAAVESNSLEENMVNYRLFPREDFGEFVTLRTAKSCPFSCAFCGFPQRAGQYTYLPLSLVEQELDAIREIGGVTTLTFIDDTFNVPKGRFKEILRLMIRKGYGFKWNSFFRSDHADEEAIELMGKAGCEGVFLGIESGSDSMLERMNKAARQRHYAKAIPLLREAGISTHASLIIGFPGETFDTVQETMDFIEDAKPDFFRAQLWYCDPTTPIWQQREHYGVKGSAFNWSHNTMDADTAADLVDRMFLSIQNSVWLPQYGFEQWSTFYLQRKGMRMDHIKRFVEDFNTIIKDRLLHTDTRDIDPQLLQNLKQSSQFDKAAHDGGRVPELYSGAAYRAGEQFWTEMARRNSVTVNLDHMHDEQTAAHEPLVPLDWSIEPDAAGIAGQDPDGIPDTLLAAYSVLLSRLSGRAQTTILTAVHDTATPDVLPLMLEPAWELTFGELVQHIRHVRQEAAPHVAYGRYVLTNRTCMAWHDLTCPDFDTGFIYSAPASATTTDLMDPHGIFPAVSAKLGLVLQANYGGTALRFRFSYAENWLTQPIVAELYAHYRSILTQVAASSQIRLADIRLGERVLAGQVAAQGRASGQEEFDGFSF